MLSNLSNTQYAFFFYFVQLLQIKVFFLFIGLTKMHWFNIHGYMKGWALSTGDMLSCYRRKSTDVINNVNDGSIYI